MTPNSSYKEVSDDGDTTRSSHFNESALVDASQMDTVADISLLLGGIMPREETLSSTSYKDEACNEESILTLSTESSVNSRMRSSAKQHEADSSRTEHDEEGADQRYVHDWLTPGNSRPDSGCLPASGYHAYPKPMSVHSSRSSPSSALDKSGVFHGSESDVNFHSAKYHTTSSAYSESQCNSTTANSQPDERVVSRLANHDEMLRRARELDHVNPDLASASTASFLQVQKLEADVLSLVRIISSQESELKTLRAKEDRFSNLIEKWKTILQSGVAPDKLRMERALQGIRDSKARRMCDAEVQTEGIEEERADSESIMKQTLDEARGDAEGADGFEEIQDHETQFHLRGLQIALNALTELNAHAKRTVLSRFRHNESAEIAAVRAHCDAEPKDGFEGIQDDEAWAALRGLQTAFDALAESNENARRILAGTRDDEVAAMCAQQAQRGCPEEDLDEEEDGVIVLPAKLDALKESTSCQDCIELKNQLEVLLASRSDLQTQLTRVSRELANLKVSYEKKQRELRKVWDDRLSFRRQLEVATHELQTAQERDRYNCEALENFSSREKKERERALKELTVLHEELKKASGENNKLIESDCAKQIQITRLMFSELALQGDIRQKEREREELMVRLRMALSVQGEQQKMIDEQAKRIRLLEAQTAITTRDSVTSPAVLNGPAALEGVRDVPTPGNDEPKGDSATNSKRSSTWGFSGVTFGKSSQAQAQAAANTQTTTTSSAQSRDGWDFWDIQEEDHNAKGSAPQASTSTKSRFRLGFGFPDPRNLRRESKEKVSNAWAGAFTVPPVLSSGWGVSAYPARGGVGFDSIP